MLLRVSFESNEEYLLFVKLIFTHITQVCVYCWQCMVARRERRKLPASNTGWLNSVPQNLGKPVSKTLKSILM